MNTQHCATGCTTRGTHQPQCTTQTCTGCQPRHTFIGNLCEWCWQRLNADIREIPSILQHLHHIGQPHPKTQNLHQDRINHKPLHEHANLTPQYLAADELTQLINTWIDYIIDTHPQHPTPPKPGQQTQWLLPHLNWIAHQDYAHEIRHEISREIATLKARWPTPEMTEPERHIPGIRCPRCKQQSLTYTPPHHPRQHFTVSCHNQDCARIFTEHEWERFVALTLHQHKETA